MIKGQPESSTFTKFYFYLQGIGCLLGWNAVLTALDWFQGQFPDVEVFFVFPLPIFIFNLLLCPFMPQISKFAGLDARIAGSTAVQIGVLVLLPILAELLPNTAGFLLIMALLAVLGAMNTIQSASCAGLAANFPFSDMGGLITGYGLAGMIINGFRGICLGIFGPEGGIAGIAVYFTCAVGITLLCILVHYKFIKTEYCQYYLNKAANAAGDDTSFTRGGEELNSQLIFENDTSSAISGNQVGVADDNSQISILPQSNQPPTLFGVWKEVALYSILMIVNYIQTFLVFPGVALMKQLDFVGGGAWSALILIFSLNFGDTVGKMMTGYRNLYNKYSIAGMVAFRFLFFINFIILAKNQSTSFINTDWFAVLNMLVFTFMNGFHTSSLFIMGPESVKDNKKETAGFIMQLSLYIGIISGTFLALPLANINKP